jgi:hypothetical protein
MNSKCSICSDLKDKEYAFQKYGSDYNNSYLPESVNKLTIIKDYKPGSDRLMQLRQCPECRIYYLYETDYEYLAFGSEDEQFLTCLSEKEAFVLLQSSDI